MRICTVGTGYVGLVTGVVLADLGHRAICVDNDQSKIDAIEQGQMPFYEPGLEEMVLRNVEEGRLSFSSDLGHAVRESEIIFIAVGTPPLPDGRSDLSAVVNVAEAIAENINGYKVIVDKSTVPVGTADLVRQIVEQNMPADVDFDVVSNPEFLAEGSAIADSLNPDRIVIGAPNKRSAMRMMELYSSIGRPMLLTDVRSAEMTKYASNAFLATKISFINSIANICEKAGADVTQVARGMSGDSRIGPHFLRPGLGFGGSCFDKDASSLIHTAASYGYDFSILKAVLDVNAQQPARFVDRISESVGDLDGKTIAILGLAFKPDTDDVRHAKSIEIIGKLLAEGATVKAYDPVAADNARRIFPQIEYAVSPYDAAEGADALVLVTEWSEFKNLDMERVKELMASPVIFDGRNIYDPRRMKNLGFDYHCIGRHPRAQAQMVEETARVRESNNGSDGGGNGHRAEPVDAETEARSWI